MTLVLAIFILDLIPRPKAAKTNRWDYIKLKKQPNSKGKVLFQNGGNFLEKMCILLFMQMSKLKWGEHWAGVWQRGSK